MPRSRSRSRSPHGRVFTERRRSRSRSKERRKDGDRRRSRSRSPKRRRHRSISRSPSPRRHRRSPSPRRRRSRSSSPRRSRRSHSKSPSDKRKSDKDFVKAEGQSEIDGVADGEEVPNQDEEAMMKMMGFSNFDSTKGKHVAGACNMSSSSVKKANKYRQYMNRRGGFNRPLDYVN